MFIKYHQRKRGFINHDFPLVIISAPSFDLQLICSLSFAWLVLGRMKRTPPYFVDFLS
jgi:hypothetical protein